MPEQDASMEAPAVDLVGYKTTREEIITLYQGVCQLKMAPGAVPGDPEEAEKTYQEILDMLKEHLQHRWASTQPEEELRWRSTGTQTSRMTAQAEFHDQTQVTYDHFGHFQDRQQESCEEALRVPWDAHHQVLAAATLLEGHIERLGHCHPWAVPQLKVFEQLAALKKQKA